MGGELIEVDKVLYYALVVAHVEIFQVAFAFAFRVMQSKVFSQL